MRPVSVALCLLSLTLSPGAWSAGDARRPSVIVMVADDLGWNDVGFHGGDIDTPSLDRLARAQGLGLLPAIGGRDPGNAGARHAAGLRPQGPGLAARRGRPADL